MASSSGTSSGSSLLQNSGSEEDLQLLMNQRKKKRMLSNRESARRSRLRKQKHLDDLMSQVAHLRKENSQILTSLNMTTQHYLNIESENSVLRAQEGELSHRLQSLNEIIQYLNANNIGTGFDQTDYYPHDQFIGNGTTDHTFMNQYTLLYMNQPIMPPAEMLQY